MKGQTVHKYPMHQWLMVYHGDNGLCPRTAHPLLAKTHVFYIVQFRGFFKRSQVKVVWKALISVKKQTQTAELRNHPNLHFTLLSMHTIRTSQNFLSKHWISSLSREWHEKCLLYYSFQTFSRVSFSWAALVFKKEQPSCLDERNFFQKEHHQCACSALTFRKIFGTCFIACFALFFLFKIVS